jgi:hypothetical protein
MARFAICYPMRSFRLMDLQDCRLRILRRVAGAVSAPILDSVTFDDENGLVIKGWDLRD